jgi:hypothetical protein
MEFQKYRSTLEEFTCREGKTGMFNYCTKKNSFSIDGLPSLALLRNDAPKYVEPSAEDGYIFGKVVDTPLHNNAVAEARKIHAASTKGILQICPADLWLLGSVMFVTGTVTGIILLRAAQSWILIEN